MGWSGVVCSVLWLCAIYSCVLAQSVYFFSHFESVFMLTKLPLLSQWVTFWPPQDSAHVHVANTRHGGSGPGVWACVNTRHRWVAPWACCCSLPSAASSGCPDSNLIRLTVTRILISSNSVPLCWIPLLPVSHFLSHRYSFAQSLAFTAEDTVHRVIWHMWTHAFIGKECV